MPELPEVETVRRGLAPRLVGMRVCAVVVRRNDLRYKLPPRFSQLVKECVFCALKRRGKYLLADMQNNKGEKTTMIVHLGMTGALFFSARKPVKAKHEHIGFLLPDGEYLVYRDPRRFGCILLSDDAGNHPLIRAIGREPLAASFNGAFLHQQWRGKKTAVKSALMDGGIVAGIGNIYAAEALFLAGICPTIRAGLLTLSQCRQIAKAVKTILRDALKAGGSTIRDFVNSDGEAGHFQMQWRVYERGGMQCTRCPSRITAIRQNNRTTYYCPRCQPSLY
ncbi:MAG: bifunctional DNA-formamidopyrimidine glycosylase/DNA-(apurinic or apyrimidinic site) lyase [Gammaproteobacteria bacterium]